ncbi:unnamed protein product [Cunninghamella echinulata]
MAPDSTIADSVKRNIRHRAAEAEKESVPKKKKKCNTTSIISASRYVYSKSSWYFFKSPTKVHSIFKSSW